MKNKLNRH